MTGVVGPPNATTPYVDGVVLKKNQPQDVLLVQKLINIVANAGYVETSVLGVGTDGRPNLLLENGIPSLALWNAIKQIELLYFHGRANPHGIAVIDPQADESLFTFLVALANGSEKAKKQLSVQMKALAAAMVPDGMVKMDAGGKDPEGNQRPPLLTRIDYYLPGLLDGLSKIGLNDTDWILLALACVRTETGTFVPHSENAVYCLNTSGTFYDLKTGQPVWTSDPATVHTKANAKQLAQNYAAQVKTNHTPTERWAEDKTSTPGDLYQTNKGLGNTQPGDGWLFRGRGFIQLTGRDLYKHSGEAAGLGDLFLRQPDQVNSEQYAGAAIAGYLKYNEKRLEDPLNKNNLDEVRHRVNGRNYGLKEFKASFAAGRALIAQSIIAEAKMIAVRKRKRKA